MNIHDRTGVVDECSRVCGFNRERNDHIGIRGHVVAELFGPDGRLKQREETHNLVTDVGDVYLAQLAYGDKWATNGLKLGSASTAAAKNGAGSFNAVADYISGSAHAPTLAVGSSNNILKITHTWAAGEATGTSRRMGWVNNTTDAGEADATNTAAMTVFDADIPKGASDTLAITWNITFLGA
jgi:hypothetical protein